MYRQVRKGFTLLELLLVLAIISVLAAVQLPRFVSLHGKSALRGEAQALHMAMLTARTKAVFERRTVRMMIEHGGDAYWFEQQVDPINAPEEYERVQSGPLGRRTTTESRIIQPEHDETRFATFLPDGTVEGVPVRLTSNTGLRAAIDEGETNPDELTLTYSQGVE